MHEQLFNLDIFLNRMHELEMEIRCLIKRSCLSEEEQKFILEHFLVIPGKEFTLSDKY
ncbi:hypothetical protein [Paenibacillus illinoisensis]|uniref:hypothetical protein n=1 Tax=Paenibacillus illinoisensis TaxID=59845 RepID=UPI00301C9892